MLRNLFPDAPRGSQAEPAAQRWKQTQRQPLHELLQRQRLQWEGAAVPAPATCSGRCAGAVCIVTTVGKGFAVYWLDQ